ncbi:MAG: hypothetical protein N3E51_03045 [Candidatus Micrarchaeota archaeon]|nr:hypothetical protein [Candidatus Micrarchaeota archaeon]
MNELTFLDLVILRKIDSESTVEKFGPLINTSFFETANLLGTVKIKGYINIESSVGGSSRVTITDAGSSILAVASQRAKEPLEPLDNAILHAVASGARELEALQNAINVRSADLAFHIFKLVSQGLMDYEVRSAKVRLLLTEAGFNATGAVRVQQTLADALPPKEEQAKPQEPQQQQQAAAQQSQQEAGEQQARQEKAFAPPWVKPEDVKPKEDVAHLLSDEHGKKHPHSHKEASHKPEAKKLSPEEAKRQERRRRFISKLEYYFVEYAPYIILIIVVLLIFTGALYLSFTRVP